VQSRKNKSCQPRYAGSLRGTSELPTRNWRCSKRLGTTGANRPREYRVRVLQFAFWKVEEMPTASSAKPRAVRASTPSSSNLNASPVKRFIRLRSVMDRTGFSRPTIYRRMRRGEFPQAINLGGKRAVAWLESSIDQWMDERIQAASESAPRPETGQVA
jgi:prophage regulatory protein